MPLYVLFILAIVFTLRVRMVAKSKGISPTPWIIGGLASAVVMSIASKYLTGLLEIDTWPTVSEIISTLLGPLVALIMLHTRQEREGAPGKQYFSIVFNCPECKSEVTFPRSRRGLAADCPECGEVLRVPNDEAIKQKSRVKPRGNPGDVVVLRNFTTEHLAARAQDLLEQAGIESSVASNTAGSALTFLPENYGADLKIELKDWDRALNILEEDDNNNAEKTDAAQ